MELFSRFFERSKLNKQLISISKYDDDDRFWCGYVIDYNETLVRLRHFSRFGKPDGDFVFLFDKSKIIDVTSVTVNDQDNGWRLLPYKWRKVTLGIDTL